MSMAQLIAIHDKWPELSLLSSRPLLFFLLLVDLDTRFYVLPVFSSYSFLFFVLIEK